MIFKNFINSFYMDFTKAFYNSAIYKSTTEMRIYGLIDILCA